MIKLYKDYLDENRKSANLLLALGVLHFTSKMWSDAKGYIESSIAIKPSLDAYLYLLFIAKKINNQMLFDYLEQNLVADIHHLT